MKINVKYIWPWLVSGVFCLLVQLEIMIFSLKVWSMSYGPDYKIVVPGASLWAAENWYVGSIIILISFFLSMFLSGRLAAVFRNIPLLIVWLWLFMVSYSGFLGDMSLHHDSEFEFVIFCKFFSGIFPISLMVILIGLGIDVHASKHRDKT